MDRFFLLILLGDEGAYWGNIRTSTTKTLIIVGLFQQEISVDGCW